MNLPNRRSLAYLAIAATQLMVILDGTVVTVALPAIRTGLGFSDVGLPWVVNAFFVAFALVLLPAGRLGDRIGTRPVFLSGLVVFTLASLWCGVAGEPASLLAARALQGIGGGMSTAVALGMVARLYTDPVARGRAFAGLAFVGSAGASIGLVAGGLITQALSWPWVFLVNVPFGGVAVTVAFLVLERTPGAPTTGGLVPRGLFADRRFAIANGVLFTMVMAGMSFQYLTTLYLQDTLGFGPLVTGAAFLATSGAIAVSSLLVSGKLAAAYGPARTLVAGLVLFAGGMLLMARTPDDGTYWVDVFVPMLAMGTGFGLAMPQVTELAMSAVSPSYTGVASGFFNTTQQAGGAIGLFVIAGVAVATDRSVGYVLAAVGLIVGVVLASVLARRSPSVETPDLVPSERL